MARVNKRFCPDCGSPAEGNPCWFFFRRQYDSSDPPCFGRQYDRELTLRVRERSVHALKVLGVVLILAAVAYAGITNATSDPSVRCSLPSIGVSVGGCR